MLVDLGLIGLAAVVAAAAMYLGFLVAVAVAVRKAEDQPTVELQAQLLDAPPRIRLTLRTSIPGARVEAISVSRPLAEGLCAHPPVGFRPGQESPLPYSRFEPDLEELEEWAIESTPDVIEDISRRQYGEYLATWDDQVRQWVTFEGRVPVPKDAPCGVTIPLTHIGSIEGEVLVTHSGRVGVFRASSGSIARVQLGASPP